MRPTSAPQRSLVACRPRPGPASGRSREPRLRPAVRTPLSVLRRLARACGRYRLTSTLPRRLWPKEFWVPDVPRGPRLHPSGRRWATWLTVPGGRCRVARPGPAAQGPALPLSKPDTPREEGAGPPGRNEAASAHTRDARSGRPRWPARLVLGAPSLGPSPSSLLLGPLPCLAIHTGDRAARSWARHSEATRVRSRLSLVPSGSFPHLPTNVLLVFTESLC